VVEELGKPAFTACDHACAGGGCGRYDDRPASCRTFRCLWLDGHLSDEDRPDKLGVIFTTTTHESVGVHPLVVEAAPGSASDQVIADAVQRLTAKSPVLVLTRRGGTFHPKRQAVEAPSSPRGQVQLTVEGRAA
jgi:hypothetical protein